MIYKRAPAVQQVHAIGSWGDEVDVPQPDFNGNDWNITGKSWEWSKKEERETKKEKERDAKKERETR